jgi:HEAT repeat protein
LLPQASTVRWFVPALVGILATAYFISALVVRRQYGKALVEMLEQEDYSFLLSQEASDLTAVDPDTLAKLQEKLEASTSHEITVFMAKLIAQVGGSKAVAILDPAARTKEDARTRSAIVDVIVASDLHGDMVYQLFTDLLADPDGGVRQSAIAGLEALSTSRDGQFVPQMLQMLQDPVTDVRVQALAAIVRSGSFYQSPVAVKTLDQLLADQDPEQRAQGVHLLGQLGESATRRLVEFLSDAEDRARLEAAVAVEEQAQYGLSDEINDLILKKTSSLLRDPVERVRQATLAVLGRIGTDESYTLLVDALTDPSSSIRETAVDALAQAGKSVIPIIHPKLDSSNPQLRKMAIVVLSRVSPREFGGLILGSTVTGNLLAIYCNLGLVHALAPCSEYPSVDVLQSALRERNQQLLDEVFYQLTAIHSPDDVRIVREALRSEDPHVRANAAEALESLTTPQMDDLIAPLFEPDLSLDHLLSISKEAWDMPSPDTARAIRQLVTDSGAPWLRAITIFVLGEMGASLLDAPTEKLEGERDTDDSKARSRQARRLSSADLFSALDDNPEEAPVPPSEGVGKAQTLLKNQVPFTLSEIEEMLGTSLVDPVDEVRLAAQAARRAMAGFRIDGAAREEEIMLSAIEKIIFLKEVPFFQGMTIDQLKVLANVCEEIFFEKDTHIYDMGDPGGVLYVVVNGRVGIEQEKRVGSFARLADIGAHSYFGEMNLFDDSPRSTSAIAVKDTLTLRLRREPLIALARQHPDLSLELINVLSQRLRETSNRIADLTRTRPRELHKLFDQFD